MKVSGISKIYLKALIKNDTFLTTFYVGTRIDSCPMEPDHPLATFGQRLKFARLYRDMTQEQLEEKSGLSQQTIGKLEREHHRKTSKIVALAMALNVRPEWLENGGGDMEPAELDRLNHAYLTASADMRRALLLTSQLNDAEILLAIAMIESMINNRSRVIYDFPPDSKDNK